MDRRRFGSPGLDGVIRGDLITIVTSGDYGKPRPALIVQSDLYATHPSITVLPLTSTLQDAPLLRITVEADPTTGLRHRSQIMVDRMTTILREKSGSRIGALNRDTLHRVDEALAQFLALR